MLFNTLNYVVFFLVVGIILFVLPQKLQNMWLLLASYYYYAYWNKRYLVLIVAITIFSYIFGVLIQALEQKKEIALILGISGIVTVLIYFKYFSLIIETINIMLGNNIFSRQFGINVVLPVGISFYSFQAIGYLIDVWRGKQLPEKNIVKYSLFISFFPQLVAGPIERSGNFISQLNHRKSFSWINLEKGLNAMLYGYFLKMVVGDRIAFFVDEVFRNYNNYAGVWVLGAMLAFSIQIYCDFAGYSSIAIGSAKILGFELSCNFRQPYFACDLRDFWRRWHITLTQWFKDYLYIPLGGGRKGTKRKQLNKCIVFIVSGIWHGAALHFAFWGLINWVVQMLEDLRDKSRKAKSESRVLYVYQRVSLFMIASLMWLFFRAESVKKAVDMLKYMVHSFNFAISLTIPGLEKMWLLPLMISLCWLVYVDYRLEKSKKTIMDYSANWHWFTIFGILIFMFGVYGGSDASAFIYFQF